MTGVGILTHSREGHYSSLIRSLYKSVDAGYVDWVYTVKDGGGPKYSDENLLDTLGNFIEYDTNQGIGKCKQTALDYLKDKECTDIFLIEDDLIIKSADVFCKYIETAKKLNLPHLMFSQADKFNPLKLKTEDIGLYEECRGSFTYFTREALTLDFDLNYYNALEHVDHYYTMQTMQWVPPMYWFPDILNSSEYIGNNPTGTPSTINNNPKYNDTLKAAFDYWNEKWGFTFRDYIFRDKNDINSVVKFLKSRINKK